MTAGGAGMTENMTARPGLKQGKQSIARTRFKSGGAGKAVFCRRHGRAGRAGGDSGLKQREQSLERTRFESGGAGKAAFCRRPGQAGRAGGDTGWGGILHWMLLWYGAMRLIGGVRFGFVRFRWCQVG